MIVVNKYNSHPIEPDILSRLNVDQAGEVVSAETWRALWELVWHSLSSYDACFTDIYRTLAELSTETNTCVERIVELEACTKRLETSWKILQQTYEEIAGHYEDIVNIHDALEEALVWYGTEAPPKGKEYVKLWIVPTSIAPALITAWGANDMFATDYNYASAKLVKDTLNTKLGQDTVLKKVDFHDNTITSFAELEHNDGVVNFNVKYPVESNAFLDVIAYEDKTYRDIFITGDMLNSFGGYEKGIPENTEIVGEPIITSESVNSGNHSLKAFGASSNYLRIKVIDQNSNIPDTVAYNLYCAGRVNCKRYVTGQAGIALINVAQQNLSVSNVTDGFVTVSGKRKLIASTEVADTYRLQVVTGAFSTANLDCYVDDVVLIDLSMFTVEPSIERLDAMYEEYIRRMKGLTYTLKTVSEESSENFEVETVDNTKKTIHFKQAGETLSAVLSRKEVVSGNANPELDKVAYGGKTYREIFVDGNCIPIGNFLEETFTAGDFPSEGVNKFTAIGSPKITDAVHYSSGLSLQVSGTTPNYIRRIGNNPGGEGTYYIAFKGKVDRYASGNLGVQAATGSIVNINNVIKTVTPGFITSSCIVEELTAATTFNIGAYGTVDLDGFIDDIVAINILTMFDELPEKETMDALYEQYLDIIKAPKEVTVASEEIIISAAGNASEDEVLIPGYTDAECISAFMEKVNEKAAELGMDNTAFSDASGYDGKSLTTSRDLVKLFISATSYNALMKVWGKDSKVIVTKNTPAETITVETTVVNETLENSYYIFGGKTGAWGTGDDVTLNLGVIGEVAGKMVVGVVMKCDTLTGRFTAMKELFDIAKQIIENPNTDTSALSVTHADSCCCCIVPEHNVNCYENYPFNYLFEQNADVQYNPASVTKVIASMVMLDHVNELNETIEFITSDLKGGSGAVFSAGDIITYKDGLFAIMLPSSNMTSQCVARHVGKKILALG